MLPPTPPTLQSTKCPMIMLLVNTSTLQKIQPSLTMDRDLQIPHNDLLSKLKSYRDDMTLNHRSNLTQYYLTASTTDATIEKLNVAQSIFALTKYCENKNIIPDDKYMRSLSKHQLLIEVTKARDVMNGNTSTTATAASKPPVTKNANRTLPRKNATKRELTQNLFGVDTDKLDSHKEDVTQHDIRASPKPSKDDDVDNPGHIVTESVQDVYSLHAKLEVGSKTFHTSSLVRTLVLQMRKGDPLIQIVPVLNKNAKSSEKLESEDAIPDDEDKLKKWAENIRTDKSKFYFTMKFRTINIDHVKTAVYGWCKGKSHWVDFTTLDSVRVLNGGWFHGIHPFYYNRDHFTDYILEELPHLDGKLDIYQKKSSKRMITMKRLQPWLLS